jgi:hypothetical protein
MIGVVGKQNKVEMPSRFRISAITSMTSIDVPPNGSFRVPAIVPANGRSLTARRAAANHSKQLYRQSTFAVSTANLQPKLSC